MYTSCFSVGYGKNSSTTRLSDNDFDGIRRTWHKATLTHKVLNALLCPVELTPSTRHYARK